MTTKKANANGKSENETSYLKQESRTFKEVIVKARATTIKATKQKNEEKKHNKRDGENEGGENETGENETGENEMSKAFRFRRPRFHRASLAMIAFTLYFHLLVP